MGSMIEFGVRLCVCVCVCAGVLCVGWWLIRWVGGVGGRKGTRGHKVR